MSWMKVILGREGIAAEVAVSCGSKSLRQMATLPSQSGSKETRVLELSFSFLCCLDPPTH